MKSAGELSDETLRRVDAIFAEPERAEARCIIEREIGRERPLFAGGTSSSLERVRFAALKMSGGSIARLREAVALANLDWRDLLVAAGFADDVEAHHRWMPPARDR